MDWLHKIAIGMNYLAEGCNENKSFNNCAKCPFTEYCDAIQIGAEAGLNVDIPENWDYDSLSNNCS